MWNEVSWCRRRLPHRRCQRCAAVDDGCEVFGRRATATADQLHAEVGDELGVGLGELRWRQRVVRLAIDHRRQAGVGDDADRQRAVARQVAHGLAHVGRAGRAVQAEDIDAQRYQRRHCRRDVAAQQHGSQALLDGDRAHQRHCDALGGHRLLTTPQRGFGLQQVEAGFDQQHGRATGQQSPRLTRVALDCPVIGQVICGAGIPCQREGR
jgi:hypothetical protein